MAHKYGTGGRKCGYQRFSCKTNTCFLISIEADPHTAALHTNLAFAQLKQELFRECIESCEEALVIDSHSMKAHYYKAQCLCALGENDEALRSADKALEICVADVNKSVQGGKVSNGKAMGSLGPVCDVVLRCYRGRWEVAEKQREADAQADASKLMERASQDQQLQATLLGLVAEDATRRREAGEIVVDEDVEANMSAIRTRFEAKQGNANPETNKAQRKVPDWLIDDISFNPMVDPVIVSRPC